MKPNHNFGEAVRIERLRGRTLQQDLADAVGLSRQSIASIENGQSDTALGNAIQIARELNISLDSLL